MNLRYIKAMELIQVLRNVSRYSLMLSAASMKIITLFPIDERNKIGLEDLHQSVSVSLNFKWKVFKYTDHLKDCDCVLHSVEVSLIEFQTELGAVSAEIETLQHRSTALSTKLENRKIVEKLFGPALEELTIPPAVVRRLVQDPIDPHWVAALEILEQRSSAIGQRLKEYNQISAASDLKPIIEDLTSRVRPSRLCIVKFY